MLTRERATTEAETPPKLISENGFWKRDNTRPNINTAGSLPQQ